MFSDEDSSFSHKGSREMVNDTKKVHESRTLVSLVRNIGEYARLTEPRRIAPESLSHNPIEFRAFAAHWSSE